MMTPQKKWRTADRILDDCQKEFKDYPPLFQQILYNRGYRTLPEVNLFLDRILPENVKGNTLRGVKKAASIIRRGIQEEKVFAVYGDYDADGITSTALLTDGLRSIGAEVFPYLPDRVEEGYGLNHEAIKSLVEEKNVDILITVDCGIRALEEVKQGKELGLQIIITDHHHPGPALPPADVIINPKQKEDPYPEKILAGVGVAYKLLEGISEHFPDLEPQSYLDLVAIGTVADLVPLRGENRVLVHEGLRRLLNPRRQGVLSLMGASGILEINTGLPETVTADDIGFRLGPRINAAGRVDHGKAALVLLLEKDHNRAGELAQKLNQINMDRQDLTRDIFADARKLATAEDENPYILFAFHKNFPQGVVGLAASRLCEAFYRPAVVGQIKGDGTITASCRSIPEFNIIEALDKCQDLLVKHGGHSAAAGFTIKKEHQQELEKKLRSIAQEQLAGKELSPTLKIDAEVKLSELTPELMKRLKDLEPTGMDNPRPLFAARGVRVLSSRQVGSSGNHLKLRLAYGDGGIDAIAFRMGDWDEVLSRGSPIDIAFYFEENHFRGNVTPQLNIQDIRLPEDQDLV